MTRCTARLKICQRRPVVAHFMREVAKKRHEDIPIYPITPVLSDFPFVQTKHIFHMGLYGTLKEAAAEILRSITHTTDQFMKVGRTTRTFASQRTYILREANKFSEEIYPYSGREKIGLDIGNSEGSQRFNGVFIYSSHVGICGVK